ncbi:hypothetical protein, partial [Aeromonas salmonicida]|uniref:hypothetical protein n=1 Tax=Aeromonas salmonicida TaxID=645 RepID=UPI001BB069CC
WIMPPRSPVMDMGLCNWSEIRISYLGDGFIVTVSIQAYTAIQFAGRQKSCHLLPISRNNDQAQ